MKLPVLFLLLIMVFDETQSKKQTDDNIICVERGDALKLLYGRGGHPGQPGIKGDQGPKGYPGLQSPKGICGPPGRKGQPGNNGNEGMKGEPGIPGNEGLPGEYGAKGDQGDRGPPGQRGVQGDNGPRGRKGWKGAKGRKGKPGAKMETDMEIYILNDYLVTQSGYYNILYHVKSRDLTDNRTDTGGWGSKTAKTGNYIQATFLRPVYVTSVTVAGGFIPSWGHDIRHGYGKLDLEYSHNNKLWLKIKTFPTPAEKRTISYDLIQPITARYWRLKSAEDKWVGTTEFLLKPLMRP